MKFEKSIPEEEAELVIFDQKSLMQNESSENNVTQTNSLAFYLK
jgi:hypothetical protein